jgi:hypothetical protein
MRGLCKLTYYRVGAKIPGQAVFGTNMWLNWLAGWTGPARWSAEFPGRASATVVPASRLRKNSFSGSE